MKRSQAPRTVGRFLAFIVAIAFILPLPLYLLNRTEPASNRTTTPQNPVTDTAPQTKGVAAVAEAVDDFTGTESLPGPSNDGSAQILPITADYSFSIEIPAISLSHTIVPDVDPADKEEYLSVIESYVAHGAYTALPPDEDGNVYLFAHSRRAPQGYTPPGGWFTRIDELKAGDIITLHYHDQTYTYTVTTSFVVDPEETYVYQPISIYPDHRSLTLQTCYPRGETEQRLIVWAIGN